jgi:hypothetical protein
VLTALREGDDMKEAKPYPLMRRGWRERWTDGELLPDLAEMLAPPLIVFIVAACLFSWHAASSAMFVAFGALLGSGLSRAPMRLRMIDPSDREAILDWLARNQYRHGPKGWVPDLPRLMRMRADTIRLTDSEVIGPRKALQPLRRALTERPGGPAGA